MYKVSYYTLAKLSSDKIGNIKQFGDTYYTEHKIENIQKELEKIVDITYKNKYIPVITNIEQIKGHCDM